MDRATWAAWVETVRQGMARDRIVLVLAAALVAAVGAGLSLLRLFT